MECKVPSTIHTPLQNVPRYASAVASVLLQTSLGFIIFTTQVTVAFTLFFPPPWPRAPSDQSSRQKDSPLEAQVLAWVTNAQRESHWSSLSSGVELQGPFHFFQSLLLRAKREGDEPRCVVFLFSCTQRPAKCVTQEEEPPNTHSVEGKHQHKRILQLQQTLINPFSLQSLFCKLIYLNASSGWAYTRCKRYNSKY